MRNTALSAFLFFIVTAVLAAMPFHATLYAAPDAAEIQKAVEETLNGMLTFSCSFTTEQYQKVLDRTRTVEGALYLNARDTFKLRIERKGNLTIIDGKLIWSYLPRHKQVQISDFSPDSEQYPSPHTIFRRYANRRKAEFVGEEEIDGRICDVLELIEDKGDDVKVTVWIDRELAFPVKAREISAEGDWVVHSLRDVVLNENLDSGLFVFEPPDGVSVVDLRE